MITASSGAEGIERAIQDQHLRDLLGHLGGRRRDVARFERTRRRGTDFAPALTPNEKGAIVPHVLVIEDDPWIAWMIADDLAERGYRVSTASNGLEAMQEVEHARPDVIVLDLMLPVMDGWTFVERYQQVTGGTIVPIIVVSAARALPRSMEARGVQCYLRKPIDIEQLAGCVEQTAPIVTRRARPRQPGGAGSDADAIASPSTGERRTEQALLPRS